MKTTSKVMIALGCGALAGALLGILFAPDKGSETRRKISERTNDLSSKLKDLKDKAKGSYKAPANGRTAVENEINEYVS